MRGKEADSTQNKSMENEKTAVSCRRESMKKGKGTGVRQKHREKKERECGRKRKQDKIETRGEIQGSKRK